jgi:hypothetical protein
MEMSLRFGVGGRIQSHIVRSVSPHICILGIATSLSVVLKVVDIELPRVTWCLRSNRVPGHPISLLEQGRSNKSQLTVEGSVRGGCLKYRHRLRSGIQTVHLKLNWLYAKIC